MGVNVDEFRRQAGAGDTLPGDAACVTAAVRAVVTYLRYDPTRQVRTKYLDGTGTPELVLPGLPIDPSVTEVRLDPSGGYGQVPDTFGADTVLVQGTDYLHDAERGVLRMWRTRTSSVLGWPGYGIGPGIQWAGLSSGGTRAAYWPRVPGCVKATWESGYQAWPADLQAATIQIASWLRLTQPVGGLEPGSVSFIDTSASLQTATDALEAGSVPALGTARQLLSLYREPVITGGVR